MGGSQGCCSTSYNAQDSPPTTKNNLAQNVSSVKVEKPWSKGWTEGERLEIDTLSYCSCLKDEDRDEVWHWQRDERHHPWAGISRNTEALTPVKKRHGDFSTDGGGRAQYWPAVVCVMGIIGAADRNRNKSFKIRCCCFFFTVDCSYVTATALHIEKL